MGFRLTKQEFEIAKSTQQFLNTFSKETGYESFGMAGVPETIK